ncbi:type IV pilus biogenesis protein PilP [Klebsiella pneumoniae]|uniref:Type IV pilus biogenesis protein PilP n=1 Tax=Klebsiella pneumoniae TaxID=573 RepID=A0A377XK11_KLEPN|nr:type IV pilus biogenesis protein PilP [Klebsiella pneumoniae]
MSGKRWIFLWLPLSLLAAERDPFQPVEDPCRTAQLRNGAMAGRLGMMLAGRGFCRMGTESGDGYAWMSNCPRAGG